MPQITGGGPQNRGELSYPVPEQCPISQKGIEISTTEIRAPAPAAVPPAEDPDPGSPIAPGRFGALGSAPSRVPLPRPGCSPAAPLGRCLRSPVTRQQPPAGGPGGPARAGPAPLALAGREAQRELGREAGSSGPAAGAHLSALLPGGAALGLAPSAPQTPSDYSRSASASGHRSPLTPLPLPAPRPLRLELEEEKGKGRKGPGRKSPGGVRRQKDLPALA